MDLDSNPTKLIEVVHIGKQMLMTRGSLTTFSIANDVAKYFAIIPAAFAATYPQLNALNLSLIHISSRSRQHYHPDALRNRHRSGQTNHLFRTQPLTDRA